MANNEMGQIDDDLSNLEGLINFSFNCLVPSMNPPVTDTNTTTTSPLPTLQPPLLLPKEEKQGPSCSNQEILARRPQIPSSNLPLIAPNGARKPPHTYPELIEHAIERCGPLTVSQIYSWIMSTFPYFQSIGDVRWKPGIRHTLTTHHLFRKVRKDQKLRGWQWSLVPEDERKRSKSSQQTSAHWKKQKMQQYEQVLNDKDYNPNAAYRQLQQQIQKQILIRHKFQQQQQQQQQQPQQQPSSISSPTKPPVFVHITPQPTASTSSSSNPEAAQQFAVVNTKEFFQKPPCENDSAVLAAQQDVSLSLDESCQTNISIPASSSSSSGRHGLLHDSAAATPSLNVLNDPKHSRTAMHMANGIREEPLSVDPASFSLVDPALEESPHPNVGLLQIHQPDCEACIPPPLAVAPPPVGAEGAYLWGVERQRSPSPHPLDLSMHCNNL